MHLQSNAWRGSHGPRKQFNDHHHCTAPYSLPAGYLLGQQRHGVAHIVMCQWTVTAITDGDQPIPIWKNIKSWKSYFCELQLPESPSLHGEVLFKSSGQCRQSGVGECGDTSISPDLCMPFIPSSPCFCIKSFKMNMSRNLEPCTLPMVDVVEQFVH